jgi:hypothetical protein
VERMEKLVNKQCYKQAVERMNHAMLQVIVRDYYRTYKTFNDGLVKELSKIETQLEKPIVDVLKVNESGYVIKTENETYQLVCKTGVWNAFKEKE